MKLSELIARLETVDDSLCIFARRPWTPDADADLFQLRDDRGLPEGPKRLSLEYFLEVHVATEVLDEFVGRPGLSAEERCQRLIDYASRDA